MGDGLHSASLGAPYRALPLQVVEIEASPSVCLQVGLSIVPGGVGEVICINY